MTELEKVLRAKMYMEKLANGIDPISDIELSEDTALNNVRLSRCFFYVSDILGQIADNGGVIKKAAKPKPMGFQLPPDVAERFPFSAQPLRISELVVRVNELAQEENMKKLTATVITNWLLEKGFLMIQEYPNGKKSRLPAPQGESIGLSTQKYTGQYGEYQVVIYNEVAQHFVLDNLEAILAEASRK